MTITIASVNVNGLRAAVKNGMHAWIDERQPDIITMHDHPTRAIPQKPNSSIAVGFELLSKKEINGTRLVMSDDLLPLIDNVFDTSVKIKMFPLDNTMTDDVIYSVFFIV